MKRDEEIIMEIMELVTELGWKVVVPSDNDMVSGLIIGNQDFIDELGLSDEFEDSNLPYGSGEGTKH